MSIPHIKDSGARTEFSTGAVRDIQEGKGRCDLLPIDILGAVFLDDVLTSIGKFTNTGDVSNLEQAIREFCSIAYTSETVSNIDFTPLDAIPYYSATLELSKHFEEGAKKYGECNWQKGIPVSRYIDSAVRHYLKWRSGWVDEPHDRACLWNLVCCVWTIKHKPDMCDVKFSDRLDNADTVSIFLTTLRTALSIGYVRLMDYTSMSGDCSLTDNYIGWKDATHSYLDPNLTLKFITKYLDSQGNRFEVTKHHLLKALYDRHMLDSEKQTVVKNVRGTSHRVIKFTNSTLGN